MPGAIGSKFHVRMRKSSSGILKRSNERLKEERKKCIYHRDYYDHDLKITVRYECPDEVIAEDSCKFHLRRYAEDANHKEELANSLEQKIDEANKKNSPLKLIGYYIPQNLPFVHTFQTDVYFDDAKFLGSIEFGGSIFKKNASFIDIVLLDGRAGFNGSTFFGRVNFDNATFYGKASFSSAHFYDSASFSAAHFYDLGSFLEAKFHKLAFFAKARFCVKAEFTRAHLHGESVFSLAHFKVDANFHTTQFKKKVFFEYTKFNYATFDYANFSDFILRHVFPL